MSQTPDPRDADEQTLGRGGAPAATWRQSRSRFVLTPSTSPSPCQAPAATR